MIFFVDFLPIYHAQGDGRLVDMACFSPKFSHNTFPRRNASSFQVLSVPLLSISSSIPYTHSHPLSPTPHFYLGSLELKSTYEVLRRARLLEFEGLFGLFRVVELLSEVVCIEQMYDEHFAVIYTRIIYVAQPMHIGFVYLQLHYEHRFSRDFFPLSSRSVHKYLGVNERVTDYASAAHAQYNTG